MTETEVSWNFLNTILRQCTVLQSLF
jgi:hypothetical protein